MASSGPLNVLSCLVWRVSGLGIGVVVEEAAMIIFR